MWAVARYCLSQHQDGAQLEVRNDHSPRPSLWKGPCAASTYPEVLSGFKQQR